MEQPNAPEGSNPDDVRWLPIQPILASLTPLPTQIPPGPDDYPLARYDHHGQGRVDRLPNLPFNFAWPALAQEVRITICIALTGSMATSAGAITSANKRHSRP